MYHSSTVIQRRSVRSRPEVPVFCSSGRGYQRLVHFQGTQILEFVVEVGVPVFGDAKVHLEDREAVKASRVSARYEQIGLEMVSQVSDH
jgi:hypothetical protein